MAEVPASPSRKSKKPRTSSTERPVSMGPLDAKKKKVKGRGSLKGRPDDVSDGTLLRMLGPAPPPPEEGSSPAGSASEPALNTSASKGSLKRRTVNLKRKKVLSQGLPQAPLQMAPPPPPPSEEGPSSTSLSRSMSLSPRGISDSSPLRRATMAHSAQPPMIAPPYMPPPPRVSPRSMSVAPPNAPLAAPIQTKAHPIVRTDSPLRRAPLPEAISTESLSSSGERSFSFPPPPPKVAGPGLSDSIHQVSDSLRVGLSIASEFNEVRPVQPIAPPSLHNMNTDLCTL